MMATKKRKHINKVLNEDILNELINDVGPNEKQSSREDSDSTLNRKTDKSTEQQEKAELTMTLPAITNLYHEKLYENQKALDYLKAKGIKSPEIISLFKIGFADGSLIERLSKKQIEELKKAGLIGDRGTESLKGCITIPVFNELDEVVSLYGLDIETDKFLKPIYFTDKIPIFNEKASRVYDEVILTDNVISTLTLIDSGINNAVAINDLSNLSASHFQTLKENRVKTIVIAIDNEMTADSLKDIFLMDDFKVKITEIKKLKGLNADEIKKLLNKLEILQPEKEEINLKVKHENGLFIFTIDSITYQLAGVKDIYSNSLKIKIRIESEGDHHRDNIDLYAYRSRQNFANAACEKLNVNAVVIEKDLEKILDYFEAKHEKKKDKNKNEELELTEEEKTLGLSFLKSSDLFNQIIEDMTTLGYVGEDINKQLLYLCATSRLMDDPISVLIISQSASGKSYLVETVAKLIPDDEVIDFNTVSKQALQYMGDRLLNKFMIMGEAMHDPDIEHQIREILSGHKLSRYVVVKNEKTGEMSTERILVRAQVSSALTTTNSMVNPENASRYFIANADESREQTLRIYEAQKEKYSEERQLFKKNILPEIIKKHHAAQKLLRKITVVFPSRMREKLRFPDLVMRLRRDHERFIDLIAVVCFLRQYQKQIKRNNEFEYIECDSTDYRIAHNILLNGVLPSTVSEMPKGASTVHEELKRMSKELAKERKVKPEEVILTQREIREYTGFSHTWIKINLRILVDYEYVEVIKGGKSRVKGHYRIKKDEEIKGINFKMIPTPDEMNAILSEVEG